MGRGICLFLIVLSLNLEQASAHIVYHITQNYGNVTVKIKTYSDDNEDINQMIIFGQLAEKLSKELNYSEPILLDFNHFYVDDCTPDYFISYDKGNIEYYVWEWNTDYVMKTNAIIIRQVARQFDAQTILKLLEYAILNLKNIKSTQKQIEYDKNYCHWKINTIDTLIIKEILNTPNSELLNNILKTKIKRPEKEHFGNNFSYYWQNNNPSSV